MNFKACPFEKLILIFGFGRGASVDVGRIIFIWYASGPGIPPKPSILEEDVAFVFTMRSQNNDTIIFQAAVWCCVTATLVSETF